MHKYVQQKCINLCFTKLCPVFIIAVQVTAPPRVLYTCLKNVQLESEILARKDFFPITICSKLLAFVQVYGPSLYREVKQGQYLRDKLISDHSSHSKNQSNQLLQANCTTNGF